MKKHPILYIKLLSTIFISSLSFDLFANTYLVTNTNDAGPGSLRQAITNANSDCNFDNIYFAITSTPLTATDDRGTPSPTDDIAYSYYSIQPQTALPDIVCPVVIDGFTQNSDGEPRTSGTHSIEISGEFFKSMSSTDINNLPPSSVAGLRLVGRDTAGNKNSNNPDGSTIRGLVINKFPHQGIYLYGVDNATLISNYLGIDVTGEKLGYQNGYAVNLALVPFTAYETIRLEASNSNYIGTMKKDYVKKSINENNRNVIGASGRGHITVAHLNENRTGMGNCDPAVCQRLDIGSSANVIQGNYLGTDKDGQSLISGVGTGNLYSAPLGIVVFSANANRDNVIGGLEPNQGNLVAGADIGIMLIGDRQSAVLGNLLNSDKSKQNTLGSSNLCVILDHERDTVFAGNLVQSCAKNIPFSFANINGGITINDSENLVLKENVLRDVKFLGINVNQAFPNNQNIVITENTITGVGIQAIFIGAGDNIAILKNSIYDNGTILGGLSIDIGPFPFSVGVNPNDPGDADVGPNDRQNFPVLTKVRFNSGVMFVDATLNSTPNTEFLIELFSSPSAGDSSRGNSKVFIERKVILTDANGNASFSVSYNQASSNALALGNSGNTFINATATQKHCEPNSDPSTCKYGSTSEFSKSCEVTAQDMLNKTAVSCAP